MGDVVRATLSISPNVGTLIGHVAKHTVAVDKVVDSRNTVRGIAVGHMLEGDAPKVLVHRVKLVADNLLPVVARDYGLARWTFGQFPGSH